MPRREKGFQWVRPDQDEEPREPGIRPDRNGDRDQSRELDKLGNRLSELDPGDRLALPMDDELRREVELLAVAGTGPNHRRQLRRVRGLLRGADLDALRAALEGDNLRTARLRALERLRDALVAGGDEELNGWMAEHPDADRQQVRTLARDARAEGERGARAARRLLKVLEEAGPP